MAKVPCVPTTPANDITAKSITQDRGWYGRSGVYISAYTQLIIRADEGLFQHLYAEIMCEDNHKQHEQRRKPVYVYRQRSS